MRKIVFLLTALFLLIGISPAFAARSLVIESYKQSFTNDEEGEVKVSLDGFTDGELIFTKGAFSKVGSTNYFGYTKKGDGWVKNSATTTDQLVVKIGEWDGRLAVRPDLTDTGFNGTGDYNFKVGFYYYTSTGNLSSVNWSDVKTVNITFVPTPTPTPTSTPTPTPTTVPTAVPTNTPAPSATPKPQSTSTPKPLPSPTSLPTKIPTSSSIVKEELISPKQAQEGVVLGKVVEETTESGERTEMGKTKNKPSLLLFTLLIGTGLGCLGAAVFLSFQELRKRNRKLNSFS